MQISIKSSNNFFLNTLSLEATFFLEIGHWSLPAPKVLDYGGAVTFPRP